MELEAQANKMCKKCERFLCEKYFILKRGSTVVRGRGGEGCSWAEKIYDKKMFCSSPRPLFFIFQEIDSLK
jgi:hypothetical protein